MAGQKAVQSLPNQTPRFLRQRPNWPETQQQPMTTWSADMEHAISFRPIGPQDTAFLRDVYASTRIDELAVVDWSDEQKQDFLTMQFNA